MRNSKDDVKTSRSREAVPFLDQPTSRIVIPVNGHGLGNGAAKQSERSLQSKSSSRGVCAQILVAAAVFLLTTCNGVHIGYSAILVPQLQTENSTLATDMELGSWIASVQSIGSPIGVFLSGILMDRWGRRISLIVSTIPFTASWILMCFFSSSHAIILSARAIAGLASGLAIAPTQVLVREVTEARIRGLLTGTNFISHSLGILLVYVLGVTFEWHIVAGLTALLPFLSCLSFIFLPESPVWLVRKGQMKRANKALLWLRGGDVAKEQVKEELDLMVVQHEAERAVELRRKERYVKKGCYGEFCQAQNIKPFIIVSMFYVLQVLSGTFIVIFYAVDIINQAEEKSSLGLNRYLTVVLTGVTRLVFNLFVCFLLLWAGRRPLAVLSSVFQTLGTFSFACFLYLKNGTNITDYEFPTQGPIILTSLFFLVAANTCGYFTLPGIAMGELLPGATRGRAGAYILAATYAGFFVTTKIFPWACLRLGLHGVFTIFGLVSAAGSIYLYFFLPETAGSSLAEIESYFTRKNIMWVGRNGCFTRHTEESPEKPEEHEMQIRS